MNGDMALARQPLRHQPGGRIVIVVGHLQAVLVVTGAGDLLAPAGRGPILRLDDDIAAGREILGPARGVPAPGVARPGSAMRRDDGWIRSRPPDRRIRLGQIGGQDQAVTRGILNERGITQVVGLYLRARLAQQGKPLAFDIDVIFRRDLRSVALDDQSLAVIAHVVDADRHIGRHRDLHLLARRGIGPDQGNIDLAQRLLEAVVQRGHLVVVPIGVALDGPVEGEAQDVAGVGLVR